MGMVTLTLGMRMGCRPRACGGAIVTVATAVLEAVTGTTTVLDTVTSSVPTTMISVSVTVSVYGTGVISVTVEYVVVAL